MITSKPLHVAFVWHMHQPYYRSARTGAFAMPWARLHALKDYLDMVETLSAYPQLHQTFNLVPSLVEQLQIYASGHYVDTYWEHTLRPAAELEPPERAFVVERMCEHPEHPRARSHPRYRELAEKRQIHAAAGWTACAKAFSETELRDLQVWFNLAWFDPTQLAREPLADLVRRGKNFSEEDKQVLAQVQADLLARTLPAYKAALQRGLIELSTSPYYHPILPLLSNSDSARISTPDITLPSRRFAHPEDAAEQVTTALGLHEEVFGERPRGMWCSEQAVGEDAVSLLIDAGLEWTISDETVLARSLAGTGGPPSLPPLSLYTPYGLERENGTAAIVFRDHTLSDLIGFAYQSWDSKEAAKDLVARLEGICKAHADAGPTLRGRLPLVTIALDGENAWEYYPHDGRDFLCYLYESLSNTSILRCVTVSEHLREMRETCSLPALGWLHTGSWIGGHLRTWIGDKAHNLAWDLLHDARDLAASRWVQGCRPTLERAAGDAAPAAAEGKGAQGEAARAEATKVEATNIEASKVEATDPRFEEAWQHILIAEGSDWFWWFGEHHHTELDYVWDLEFRQHLQEVYHRLDEPVPPRLLLPILETEVDREPRLPTKSVQPTIDGRILGPEEWEGAGLLALEAPSTMQRSDGTAITRVLFGWQERMLCLLVMPQSPGELLGLETEVRVIRPGKEDDPVLRMTLVENGAVSIECVRCEHLARPVEAAWQEVLETAIPLDDAILASNQVGLVVRTGRGGLVEHVFHSAGLLATT